jgi:hypothetical protein
VGDGVEVEELLGVAALLRRGPLLEEPLGDLVLVVNVIGLLRGLQGAAAEGNEQRHGERPHPTSTIHLS